MDISKSLQKRIDELQELIDSSKRELKNLRVIYTYFPDLQINMDRWSTRRFYSAKVNSSATNVDIHRSCGCCSDASIVVRPFLESQGYKIYSDPPAFYIGNDSYYGCLLDSNWEDILRDKNISEIVFEKIREYKEKNSWTDDDNEDDDYNS